MESVHRRNNYRQLDNPLIITTGVVHHWLQILFCCTSDLYSMTSDTSLHYTNSVSSLPIATLLLFCLVLFLLFIKKFLFCKNRSTNIRLFYDDNQFNQEVISLIPQLTRNYTPPCWIRNRVLATLIFGMFGR